MSKADIRKYILDYQNKLVEDLKKAVEDLHEGADIDEEDTIDPEDFSHQTESGDMMLRLRKQLVEAENDLKIIEEIDVEICESVRLGAFVKTQELDIYVSIPTKPFETNNRKTVGVSTGAPLYLAMINMSAGDHFEYNGVKYDIISVE